MADILRITTAAVDSLLSASSSTVAGSNHSFGEHVRVKGKKVREISIEDVLSRSSGDEGMKLAALINNRSLSGYEVGTLTNMNDTTLHVEHRTPAKGIMLEADESRHLIAPSTGSSEYISIIDVGASLYSSSSGNSREASQSAADVSRDVDLVPVRESDTRKDTSGSTISSIKTGDVVDASTPNTSSREPQSASLVVSDHPSVVSQERPGTPDLTDPPPALAPLQPPPRGLQQGAVATEPGVQHSSVAGRTADRDEVEVTRQVSRTACARHVLQNSTVPPRRGLVSVQRYNPPPAAAVAPDHTSQIAAAVAAAVAATTPFHQLKVELEQKIESLTEELRRSKETSVQPAVQVDEFEDELDLTVLADPVMTLPTPTQPRTAPRPHSLRKPSLKPREQRGETAKRGEATKRMTCDELREKFEDAGERSLLSNGRQTEDEISRAGEVELLKEDVFRMLQDARAAKHEIEEIRHCERIKSLRSSAHRTDTPADIYLDQIRQREDHVMRRKPVPEYRTPEYIRQGKDVLFQAEEKRRSFEENRYPLDTTYLCEEQSPEEEEIARRISDIFDQMQQEVKSKDPKQTKTKGEPVKRPKPRPRKSSKVAEKKVLYAQLRAGNEYQRLQANIGRLKEEEGELRRRAQMPDKSFFQSPYERAGLPKSYPLAPPQSYHHPPQSYPLHTPQAVRQSTPLLAHKPISTQTSPLCVELLDPAKYTREPASTPHMVDQQCSPLKMRDVTADPRDVTLAMSRDMARDMSRDLTHRDEFLEVVDVADQIVIRGCKPQDSKILGAPSRRTIEPAVQVTLQDSDKISVMQWLEDAILEKLLSTPAHTGPAQTELTELLGHDVLDKIGDMDLGLSPEQLHVVVADIVREQVEAKIEAGLREEEKKTPASPDKKSGEYEETFESSTSRTSSSLSIVQTPTLSSASKSDPGEDTDPSYLRSPPITPPLTPEGSNHHLDSRSPRADTTSHQLYRPTSPPDVELPAPFHDTLEQVPLDETEERSYATVATPDLTLQSRDFTTKSRDLTTMSRDVTRSRDLRLPTPQNTQVLSDSLVSQHPLDATQQSFISQHPLDRSHVSQGPLESTHASQYAADDLSHVTQEISCSTTYSITETTDYPISAGEILKPGLSDLAHEAFGDAPLSEGEWPLSPEALLHFVRDPDIRELLGQRVLATRDPSPIQETPVRPTTPRSDGRMLDRALEPRTLDSRALEPRTFDTRTVEPRTLPPQPRKVSVQTPSPLPKTQSVDNFETLELVTPLPDSVQLDSPSPPDGLQPRAPSSPSPPPFMGLQLEDYNFMSEESLTRSDSF